MKSCDKRKAQELWARYKYCVMEKSYGEYKNISRYFSGNNIEINELKGLLNNALSIESSKGQVINTLQHVWGYFKKVADVEEKTRFFSYLSMYEDNACSVDEVKDILYKLSRKYNIKYLLDSFYFDNDPKVHLND